MKYLKKKKKPIRLWLLLALIVLLAVLILVVTLQPGGEPASDGETTLPTAQSGETEPGVEAEPTGEASGPQATSGPESSDPIEATEPPVQPSVEDVKIETPYAVLYYPGDWSGLLQVDQISGDPYEVVFTANLDSGITQELFTIGFGGGVEDSIGVVNVSGREVPVHLTVQDIEPGSDWTANEISVVYAMQECMNDVLAGLKLTTPQEAPQSSQTTLPPEDDGTMAIDTPVGELYYPSRWQEYLKLEIVEGDAYTLEFYTALEGYDPVHLFDIHLGGDQGIYVSDLTATDGSQVKLYVEFYDIEENINWTDAQKAIVFAMQEDINVLLSELN